MKIDKDMKSATQNCKASNENSHATETRKNFVDQCIYELIHY